MKIIENLIMIPLVDSMKEMMIEGRLKNIKLKDNAATY